jgi:glycosyltransferase involved in cell wall biosynthesis
VTGIVFSIVIITRNRENVIQPALEAVKKLDFPRSRFELIVVDNGSSDSTADAVRRVMQDSGVVWRIETEPVAGICRARNKGYASAAGAWVLYLDDDALVPAGWLTIYQQAINAYPGAVAYGGPATLDPALPRPWWWIDVFDRTMSCQDYGNEYHAYPEGTNPYGLNMLIRKDILVTHGGFDERLDTLTNSFADETELFLRLRKQGGTMVYVPGARVIHSVMPDRLHWRNFMNRFRLVGRSHACLDRMHNTWHARRLWRRMTSAMALFLKYGSPAVFFTELYAWDGYRRFRYGGPRHIPIRQKDNQEI